MSLSDKRVCMPDKDGDYNGYNALLIKDVKKSIKELEKELDLIIGFDKSTIQISRDLIGFRHNKLKEIFGKELLEKKE